MTPMMEQWTQCKQKSGEAILLFRLGDFYEAFYEDAEIMATALELTLTHRQGIPMSGVPHHAVDGYIDRLIDKGFKVAVAEQLGSLNDETKQPIKRDIVRFITPGTLLSSSLLTEKTHNYIISLTQLGQIFGLAALDISTGLLEISEYNDIKDLINELYSLQPSEILVSQKFSKKRADVLQEINKITTPAISIYKDWHFEHEVAYKFLIDHFKTSNLEGFGIKELIGGINAAGGLLSYIRNELFLPIDHITSVVKKDQKDFLIIDRISYINLELTQSSNNGKGGLSLLEVIDKTLTPMGGRFLKMSLNKPLLSVTKIIRRQEAVSFFYHLNETRYAVGKTLKSIRDIERLINKIITGYASPKDVLALGSSLENVVSLYRIFNHSQLPLVIEKHIRHNREIEELARLIFESIVDHPPLKTCEGGIFKTDYNEELKRLRYDVAHREEWILNYQETLRKQTGSKKLKIHFNNVLGYYIEISGSQKYNLPETFIRKQTRLNAERFISHELKDFESYMLTAREQSFALEENLFKDFRNKIAADKEIILKIAHSVARIDFFHCLATVAKQNNYTKPIINATSVLKINNGRHPVIEKTQPSGQFIANDCDLNNEINQFMLITGPNMAGKSTYIRQNALIVLLAQMGSFVPADHAEIGIVDKIFTRIGAADNLSRGMSTFMVEMTETANILNNATDRSLIILDEIGRGTGTYDGLAIAQAVIEFLMETKGKQAKTLFATHYRELIHLEKMFPKFLNYHAEVSESGSGPIFLHKILKGCAAKSYGIHIAKLAGFPFEVISRAQELLNSWEQEKEIAHKTIKNTDSRQLTLF